ncbi:MAG: chemotaxis response regulator protein-glutamate methylesterase [Planctomycetota bacterium]
MNKLRVLIVDDAIVVRRMLTNVLSDDPELLVAGTAPNGRVGLTRIEQVQPDVVILDVEMPVLDGLETVSEIRKKWPRLPVIMFSTRTERGAAATLEALSRGASDYVAKPANVGSVSTAMDRIRQDLIPKIKALCGRLRPVGLAVAATTLNATSPAAAPSQKVDAIVVAVSTGGPNALADIVSQFPATLPIPILIVQHMPPTFTQLLAQRLDAQTPLEVRESQGGEVLGPNQIWIAPGGRHLTVRRQGIQIETALTDTEPVNSCRPAADVLFQSAVEVFGNRVLGVVLTGMGQDGLLGAQTLKAAGARVLVQDRATSIVWGMPGAVAQAGLADDVVPLGQVAPRLTRAAQAGRGASPAPRIDPTSRPVT